MRSQIAFEIEPELKEKLKKFSKETGINQKFLLNSWIKEQLEYFEGMEKEGKKHEIKL